MPTRRALIAAAVVLAGLVTASCSSGGASNSGNSSPASTAPSPSSKSPSKVSFPASDAWNISTSNEATDTQLSGYTGASSIRPGDPLPVYVSAPGDVAVSVFRLEPAQGKGAVQVAAPQQVSAQVQTAIASDPATRATSAPWPVTTTLKTSDWPPGLYFLHLQMADGKARNVPFVVRDTDLKGKVVFAAGDTTWQAYNSWGGRSLYKGSGGFDDRSYAVSFDRPYSSADWQIWYDYDVSVVMTLEAAGVPVGYTTVSAVAMDPGSIKGAEGIMSNGHDEYWPVSYRDALLNARDAGTDLAFLGANAGYWRVRLADTSVGKGRLVIGYKSASLDPVQGARDTTARYRDNPQAMPENTVIGQLYDCFPSKGDMRIVEPNFFLFAGTGVTDGSKIPGLIGNESDRAYARADTPRPIQVPALSSATCKDTTTYSTVTYYTVASGAGVFATGTMNWGRAMSGPTDTFGLTQASTDFTRAVTTNLAKAMAAGPMGRTHPAQDDYSVLEGLPNTNHAG